MNIELKADYVSNAIGVMAAIAVLYIGARIATAIEDHNRDPRAHAEIRLEKLKQELKQSREENEP